MLNGFLNGILAAMMLINSISATAATIQVRQASNTAISTVMSTVFKEEKVEETKTYVHDRILLDEEDNRIIICDKENGKMVTKEIIKNVGYVIYCEMDDGLTKMTVFYGIGNAKEIELFTSEFGVVNQVS